MVLPLAGVGPRKPGAHCAPRQTKARTRSGDRTLMTDYAYIISDHEEHGADNVHVTTDRAVALEIIRTFCVSPGEVVPDHYAAKLKQAEQEAIKLFQRSDEELAAQDGYNLGRGWGCIQLHICPIRR
jgi:arginine deiminase